MFSKKIVRPLEWISQRSPVSLVAVALFWGTIDMSTAYLNYCLHPTLFFAHERNSLAVSAFYYGQYYKLLLPIGVLITLAVGSVVLLKYIYDCEVFLNFFLIAIGIYSLGGALTNIGGIIFESPELGKTILTFLRIFSFSFLSLGMFAQWKLEPGKEISPN